MTKKNLNNLIKLAREHAKELHKLMRLIDRGLKDRDNKLAK